MTTPQGPLAESGNGVVEDRLVGRGVSVAGSRIAVDANVLLPGMGVGMEFCDGVQDAKINITALIESRRIYFISAHLSFHTLFLLLSNHLGF
jgi:hypothetical protein